MEDTGATAVEAPEVTAQTEADTGPDLQARIDELTAEIARRDAAAADAERIAAERNGEFERLYKDTSGKLEAAQGRLEQLEARVAARNKSRVAALPESMRDLIPEGMSGDALDAYLDRIEPLRDRFVAPAGTVSRTAALSAEQDSNVIEFAAKYNVPLSEAPDLYRAYKARSGSK